jgi:2,4-didehydro-3-deoxy-L-rhamnonate hydrolase
MKLVRYGVSGRERPGLVDENGGLRDLREHVDEIGPRTLDPRTLRRLAKLDPASLPRVRGRPRLGPPVGGIGKLVAIGLNYSDHAAEAGMPVPTEPILFGKAVTSVSGPDDPIVLPKGSKKVDWEAELAVVIGTTARYVSKREARSHVAGYTICNDVSERHFQLERGGQWIKGKSFDTFCPLGPWLVTADEIPDPQRLGLWLDLNGKRMQDGSTRTMIFSVDHLVSYASHCMTLLPGDVIITGTPPGVGMGRNPPRFLKPRDVVSVGIDGLGTQRQVVERWRAEEPQATRRARPAA